MLGPLGFWEIAFILVLALLIFGPRKLPEIGRTLGRGLSEFRRASDDLKRTFSTEVARDEAENLPSRPAPVRSTPPLRDEGPRVAEAEGPAGEGTVPRGGGGADAAEPAPESAPGAGDPEPSSTPGGGGTEAPVAEAVSDQVPP